MYISLLLPFLFFLRAYSISIMIPMYNYPENGAWAPLWKTIPAHPDVTFQIIINPDSGPGSTTYPEPAYITALTRLNKFPNVKLIGYVHTLYSKRDYNDVKTAIDTYAGWRSYANADISVSGIFFDEVTDAASGAAKDYVVDASAYAYAQFASTETMVVLNPGCVIDTSYFGIADMIVEFESPISQYQGTTTIATLQKGYKKQAGIMINGATGLTKTRVENMVQAMKNSNVGAVYLTSNCCYQGANATLLETLAVAVAA